MWVESILNRLCIVQDGTKFHFDFNLSTYLFSLREISKSLLHFSQNNFEQLLLPPLPINLLYLVQNITT